MRYRAHHVAGDFKLSVRQEDGTNIEELATSADGTRRGQYSYINDLGNTETVKWEAGHGGFRIINANNQPAHTKQTAAWQAAADSLAREHVAAKARVAEAVRQAALKPKPVEEAAPAPYRAPVPVQHYQHQPKQVVNEYSYQHQPQQFAPVQQFPPVQQYVPTAAPIVPTTQAPSRFFPPGQLSLSRNQLGYQYSFSSK